MKNDPRKINLIVFGSRVVPHRQKASYGESRYYSRFTKEVA